MNHVSNNKFNGWFLWENYRAEKTSNFNNLYQENHLEAFNKAIDMENTKELIGFEFIGNFYQDVTVKKEDAKWFITFKDSIKYDIKTTEELLELSDYFEPIYEKPLEDKIYEDLVKEYGEFAIPSSVMRAIKFTLDYKKDN